MVDRDLLRAGLKLVGDDLRERGVGALAVGVGAGHHHDLTARVDADLGALVRPEPAQQDVARHADPQVPPLGAGGGLLLAPARVVGQLQGAIQAGLVLAAVVGDRHLRRSEPRLPGELVRLDEVAAADLGRVDAKLAGGLVHRALQREDGLRAAGAPIRPGRRLVGQRTANGRLVVLDRGTARAASRR